MTADTRLAEDMAAAYARAVPLAKCSTLGDPELIEQHRALIAWPARAAEWRKCSWGERFGREAPALPFYGAEPVGAAQMVPQATRDAAADITRDLRDRLADGRLRVLAFEEPRRLGDEPVLLPAELVAEATAVTWRTGKLEAGGMVFVECRVIQAEAVAEPEAQPVPVPPATRAGLVEVLAAAIAEESAWSGASTADLAALVTARDPRFRPHHGPARAGRWSAATLRQRIRETRVEAREAAAT